LGKVKSLIFSIFILILITINNTDSQSKETKAIIRNKSEEITKEKVKKMSELKKKPNIICFFTDQQRWDTIGCYGQKLNVTPNIDKMASEGVLFKKAFTCQPVCGPARACIQTGKYATENTVIDNGLPLPLNEKTIANWLSETGYEVGYIGKWHLASNGKQQDYRTKAIPPERRGGYKDYWLAADVLEFTSHGYDGYLFDADMNKVDFEGYRVDCLTDFTIDYLNTRNGEKPFFLFLSYLEPHHQNDRNRCEGPEGKAKEFENYEVPEDLKDKEGNWKENYPDYLACCNSLDYNLGRIREELKKLKIDDNTIIIYFADHGCHFETLNEGYKRTCHESSIRIPLIIYGPGFKGGKVVDDIVSLIDVPPTVLASGGVEKPESMKGRPLQEIGSEKDPAWPKEAFIQISESHVGRALRTQKWKYCVTDPDKEGWRDAGSDRYYEDGLFDLEKDPFEKNNLVRVPELLNVRKELAEILKKRMVQAGEKSPEILSAK